MTQRACFTLFVLLSLGALLLGGCGKPASPTAVPTSPVPAPTARPTSAPATSIPRATPVTVATPTLEPTRPGEGPYPVYDSGQDSTWEGQPMAYLMTDLATVDIADPAFEAQVRWAYGLLSEEFRDVEVLEIDADWGERASFTFDAAVEDWEELVAGRLSWATFWARVQKYAADLETGELVEGAAVDEYMAGLAGSGPTPTRPARPTPGSSLGGSYEDPQGFFVLSYPEEWTPHRSGSEMQFWADAQGDAALAISIQVKAVSADRMLKTFSDFFSQQWENYQEVSVQEAILSGYPAVWVEQSYEVGSVPQHGLMVGVVRNRVGFLLLAWAPEDQYAALEPGFRTAIESLQVTEFPAESPPYDRWMTWESEHFYFYYLPATWPSQHIEELADLHEQTFGDIVNALGVDYVGPISFYIYNSMESLYRATARDAGFAIVEAQVVHAWWISAGDHQSPGHEMTHVISYHTLGEPQEALLGEGLAVCLDHSEKDYRAIAADLDQQGRLIPLSQMLGDAWFEYDDAYQVSGSFVCFLIDRYGVDRLKEIYTRSDFEAALEEVYDANLASLEDEWLEWLRSY